MRKQTKFLFLFVALAGLFISCSSDDDEITEPTEPAEVSLESFGFYQEDNDKLFDDYVVENISGNEVTIALPAQIDRSSLIARFTTSENDKVTVGGVNQVSGETVNDFSTDLEYMLNEENTNDIYTISVVEQASAVWSDLTAFNAEVREISMDINPMTSEPSIVYISNPEESDDRKLNLISYSGNQWNMIGAENFTPARARSVDLGFKQDGTPLVSFRDDNLDPYKTSMMAYESSSWNYVGEAGFSGVAADVSAVSTDDNGDIFGFYINDDRDDPTNRRGVFAKVFDGASWTDLPITGRTGAARTIKTTEVNGVVYLSVLDFGEGQGVSVYKYDENGWTTLADKMKESEETTIYYYDVSMAVDSQNNVYVAYAENNGEGTEYQLKVKKYSSEDQNWTLLGSNIATTEVRTFDLAVDAFDNPMLLYKNETENPVVIGFDDETFNWGGTTVLSNQEADDLQLQVAPNGVGYASYTVDNQLYVHKYDSPDNN